MMRDDASIDDVDDNGVGVSTVQQDLTALVAQLELGKKLDDALSRIHVAINGTPVFEDAMRQVLPEATRALDCDAGILISHDGAGWVVQQVCGLPAQAIGRRLTDAESTYAALALRTGEPYCVNEVLGDPSIPQELAARYEIRAFLVVPLVVRAEGLGVLSFIYRHSPIAFAAARVDFLRKLATAFSLALDNTRQLKLQSEQRRIAEQRAAELRRARDELELRVQERTAELEAILAKQKRIQERLAYQAMLLENINDAVIAYDTDLRITAWNRAAEEQYGWKAEEAIGLFAPEVVGSQLAADARAAALRAMAEGDRWRGEARHTHRDGATIFIEATSMALRDDAGQISGYVTVNRNITRRKEAEARRDAAEAALRQQTERLSLLHTIDRSILAAQPGQATAQAAIEIMQQMLPAAQVIVTLFDRESMVAEIVAAAGWNVSRFSVGSRWPLSESWMYSDIQAGRTATLLDVASLPDSDPLKADKLHEGVRSTTVAPMLVGGELIGLLAVHLPETGGLPPDMVDLAIKVANSLAVALQNARLLEELRASREQLRALSRRLVITQETERSYVADQLYNQAGQVLAALQLQLSLLGKAGTSGHPAAQLPEMKAMLSDAIRELQDLASQLRPVGLDYSALASVLNSYVTEFGQTHCLAVQFHPGETETLRLPADVSTAIFRVVQEGLANVARHAQATEIVLSLSHEAGKLIVTLADNGVGFDPLSASGPSGVGLAGMRERLETVGGRFAVESGKAGTTLCMQVPLDGEEN